MTLSLIEIFNNFSKRFFFLMALALVEKFITLPFNQNVGEFLKLKFKWKQFQIGSLVSIP
jgi:hypothetical protein